MPSKPPLPDSVTRRRLLASFSVAGTASVAGCAGQIPGTGPREVDAAKSGEQGELYWEYPEAASGEDGVGYASVTFEGEHRPERTPPSLEFQLNSTVGGIAANEKYTDYEADWAQFRLGPPAEYATQHQFEMWVQPPTWPEVSARYEQRGGRRELVVELPGIDTGGTITFPVVFDPADEPLPDRFHCSFTAQVSEPGLFGESIRSSGQGVVDLAISTS